MPAGRETDALVGKLMGLDVLGTTLCVRHHWWYVQYDGNGEELQPVYLSNCACEFREDSDTEILGHIAGCLEVVPFYSTDIAAAWEVAAESKLFTDGWRVLMFCEDEQMWWIGVPYVERGGVGFYVNYDYLVKAKTPMLAICRAALKAVSG